MKLGAKSIGVVTSCKLTRKDEQVGKECLKSHVCSSTSSTSMRRGRMMLRVANGWFGLASGTEPGIHIASATQSSLAVSWVRFSQGARTRRVQKKNSNTFRKQDMSSSFFLKKK